MSFQTPFSSSDSTTSLIYSHFDEQRDLAALIMLLSEVESVDRDGEDVSETRVREQLTWPGHNPVEDRWVAIHSEGAALFGYGALFKTANDDHADLLITVHPAWRRRGIGSELLERLLKRACEVKAQDVRTYASVQHQAAHAFLQKHAFDPVSTYTCMTVSGTQEPPLFDLPAGFVVHSYDQVQQIDVFTEAINRSYEGLWGHRHLSQEEIEDWLPQLQPEGIFLLFAPGGGIAGVCCAEASEHLTMLRGVPTGLIDAPGIVPAYRNTDLYQSLLFVAWRWLVLQNLAAIELESWGDAPATLDLYRTLGFVPVKEEISYRRNLT